MDFKLEDGVQWIAEILLGQLSNDVIGLLQKQRTETKKILEYYR